MNTELDNLIGKKFYVYTPTPKPYLGTLTSYTEKEIVFTGKDGKVKIIPRGMYDFEEVRNEERT